MTDQDLQRIAALEAELKSLRAEMQDFSYTVSHDLRASLRHIISYAQLVQEDAGPQLGAEVLQGLTVAQHGQRQVRTGHELQGIIVFGYLVGQAPDPMRLKLQVNAQRAAEVLKMKGQVFAQAQAALGIAHL